MITVSLLDGQGQWNIKKTDTHTQLMKIQNVCKVDLSWRRWKGQFQKLPTQGTIYVIYTLFIVNHALVYGRGGKNYKFSLLLAFILPSTTPVHADNKPSLQAENKRGLSIAC